MNIIWLLSNALGSIKCTNPATAGIARRKHIAQDDPAEGQYLYPVSLENEANFLLTTRQLHSLFRGHAQSNNSCSHNASTLPCPTAHCKLQHTYFITSSIYKQIYVKLGYMIVIRVAIATLRPENKTVQIKKKKLLEYCTSWLSIERCYLTRTVRSHFM